MQPRKDPLALHAAVASGHLSDVTRLLSDGADPSARGPDGRRPIHLAVATGNTAIVSALLEGGAKSTDRDSSGWTAMSYALVTENSRLLQLLLEATLGPWISKGRSWSLLHLAAERGDAAAMKILLEHGGKKHLGALDLQGRTPLHVAAAHDAAKVVTLLLDCGANPKARTDDRRTVVELANEHHAAAALRVLEKVGAKGKTKRKR
jgi:uncharacterized protein